MESEDDPRVTAAKKLLRSRLEEVFAETSAACHDRLAELEYPPPATGEADPIFRDAIKTWRERSLECITEGFKSFFVLTPESQHTARSNIAKNLTWDAINQVFSWTAEDRSNSSRFEEWRRWATSTDFWAVGGLRMVSLECSRLSSLADQLNCDFRTQFERCLNQLENEAFLNSPAAQSTKTAVASDSNANGMQSSFAHSEGYRTVTVSGKHYVLTPNQALIIQALHEASVKGTQAVSAAALRKSIGGHRSRIRDSFRSGDGRKLWKKFVTQIGKGMYALKLPSPR
jgi:hypothetical protein